MMNSKLTTILEHSFDGYKLTVVHWENVYGSAYEAVMSEEDVSGVSRKEFFMGEGNSAQEAIADLNNEAQECAKAFAALAQAGYPDKYGARRTQI